MSPASRIMTEEPTGKRLALQPLLKQYQISLNW